MTPALRARLVLGQADLGQFRIGIGHGRNGVAVGIDRRAKQRVADHEPGLMIGDMGEIAARR